jgi:hypothetical protein
LVASAHAAEAQRFALRAAVSIFGRLIMKLFTLEASFPCGYRLLMTKIDQFVENNNQNARPFVWTATADSIFARVQRLCERISGTAHL